MITIAATPLGRAEITLLAENTARGAGILGEHGLAWWMEFGGARLLFDLGQGLVIGHNAERLGINLALADAVVLSHGHYDHIGGWKTAGSSLAGKPVTLHPDALRPKYQRRADGRVDDVGDPDAVAGLRSRGVRLKQTAAPAQVLRGVFTTGQVPRGTAYEDTGGAFVSDPEGREEDPLLDDLAIYFGTAAGIVVVLGCAHAGVINTLHHIGDLTGERIHAVVGGMHLVQASEERIRRTIEDLRVIGPDWIGPNHCTGDVATAALRHAFAGRCLECHAGQTLRFPHTSA